MPTTYTHDKFGKDVYKKLPEHIKAVIRKGKGVYRIGQHGPDIFFYYKPICLPQSRINKIGPQMHKEPAFGFFQKGIREFEISPSPQLASYLFGFTCHFMLDSTCHGYVGRFEKQTGISHAEIETELDRYLMIESGKEPRVYLPASVLDDSEENCRVIARMFPSVTPKQIHRALEGQKLYDRLLTCKNPMKEKVVLGGMHVLGCYDILEGQVMRKKANPACRESTTRLMELYQKALDETPAILENLYQCLYGTGTTLSSRFLRDYH